MARFKIVGNLNPVVGVPEVYSIVELQQQSFSINKSPVDFTFFSSKTKWKMWVYEYGYWRQVKGDQKIGATVIFTFYQKSLYCKALRMTAEANGEEVTVDIKTQKAKQEEILKIDILNSNHDKPKKKFAYGDLITARVHAVNLELTPITVTLWEDDASGAGHNKTNTLIESKEADIINGRADVNFYLSPNFSALANSKFASGSASEGKEHEYYVTAESKYSQPNIVASPNFNIANEIVLPEYDPINSLLTVEVPDDGEERETGTCVCKEYDLIWGNKVSCEFRKKLVEISKKQNFDPNHLMAVMYVETFHTFSTSLVKLMPNGKFRPNGKPKKENRGLNESEIKKLSENFLGAVGLIQFTSVTIDELNNYYGYTLTKRKLALMTQLEQLDYVEKYIEFWINSNKIKTKLTLADLYLLIFSPSKMNGSSDDTTLYREGTVYYNANKSLDTNKTDGITKKELAHRAYESFDEGTKNKTSLFSCNLYKEKEKEEISSDGVLAEMKQIADAHHSYLQETNKNRTADTEAGLAKMDCSEFVSRYLHKLGVAKNIIYMTTADMVSESAFRKVIGNENIDLISGSKLDGFKPQRGDIFAWGYSNSGSWSGHTGVVYEYDEFNDVVTILEAIGSHGAISEKDQVFNGGYSGTGCTRTAKYSRLKGALYGHTGWHGYFRPKNYTKKL